MAELDTQSRPRQYLCTLRQHVLEPISAAEAIAEQERNEVALERDAFEQFAERVTDISPVSPQTPSLLAGTVLTEPSTDGTEVLRRAYTETVMDVSHYDEVYGEPAVENTVAEFGPEIASLFQPTSGLSFTEPHKRVLITATEQRATERDEFCDALDSELESLRSMRRDLTTVLDELDTSVIPSWYHEQFEDRVTDILHARQSKLRTRSPMSYLDGHNLCTYLYCDDDWTYPVLTAVARLLDSITVRDEDAQ